MEHWTLERHGAVALATFNRPPRNLMSMAAMSELEQLVESVAGDDAVHVLVLTGGVPGYFVAHADLDDLAAIGRGEAGRRRSGLVGAHLRPPGVDAAARDRGGRRPSVGWRLRAGARVHPARRERPRGTSASPKWRSASFPGAAERSDCPVSSARAAPPSSFCRPASSNADEALRIGLVEAVLPHDNFVAGALAWAERIASQPPAAVRAAKRAIVDGLQLPLDEGLRLEGRLFIECQVRPDTIAIQERVADAERVAPGDQTVELG